MDNVRRSSSVKKRIFDVIQIGNKTDLISTTFDVVISVLILLSIGVTFLQTFDELAAIRPFLAVIEFVTIIIFLVEYLLRLWTAEYLYPDKTAWRATISFVVSFYGIVDLLTIVSFFVPFLFSNGFVALKMLRVIRILRLFRLNTSYDAFNVITDVLRDKRDQIISSVALILMLMFMSSLCMYSLEHEAQPENFSNAFSGIWWSVSTLLTVGYGDIYPITIGGRIMAIVFAFLGVGMVAIPTGIISAGFVEYYSKIKMGTYSQRNDDFVILDIGHTHPFVGKKLQELALPEGLYAAVVLRGEDMLTPYAGISLEAGDSLLLATTSNREVASDIHEITLEEHHGWIGKRVKELDISRLSFVIMIRRGETIIPPTGETMLQYRDTVVLLDRR
ncbi:MAG: ion transporter [Lachnospiraceae bacterium]|nr:ion transporter [Lachnospiraceae bacterium]